MPSCQLLVENIHVTTTFELPTEKKLCPICWRLKNCYGCDRFYAANGTNSNNLVQHGRTRRRAWNRSASGRHQRKDGLDNILGTIINGVNTIRYIKEMSIGILSFSLHGLLFFYNVDIKHYYDTSDGLK